MLDPKVSALLNEQINKEFYSAYLYLDFSIYYEDEGLDGFACTSSRFMTDRQRKQLRNLIDFRFTRDRNYNLPAKRLKALEAFLQRRLRDLSKGSK